MRPLALVALLAALAALPAFADDKAEIKVSVKKGLKFTRTTEIKGEGECKLDLGGRGVSFGIPAELSAESKQAEEVLDVKDGRPVDVHRAYPTRRATTNFGMQGAQEQSHPLEGADITCKGGIWVAVAGTDEETTKALAKERAADPLTDALSSGKPVAVGNTWDADKDKVKAWMESEIPGFEATEAEMECKLGEFRDKDGRKCARIEITAKVKGKISVQGAPQSAVTIEVTGDVFYGLDCGIVVLVKCKGSVKGELDIQNDQGAKMKLDIPLEWNVSVKVGEAEFEAKKPTEKPKKEVPEFYPPPIR